MRARSDVPSALLCASAFVAFVALVALVASACSSFDEGSDASSSSGGTDGGGGGGGSDAFSSEASADAPATCGDKTVDPRNCGSCGHDCLGGECVSGKCRPIEMARSSGVPVKTIAVGGTRVFWMTSAESNDGVGGVYACAKTGCANGTETLYSNETTPGTLATDGTSVWASFAFGSSRVVMFGASGAGSEVPALSTLDRLFYMESQPDGLYAVRFEGNNDRTLFRWNAGDGMPTTVGTFSQALNGDGDIVNAFHASITTNRAFLAAINIGAIVTCDLDDCDGTWTKFASPVGSVQSMTDDDQWVYWVDNATWGVKGCVASAACASVRDVITPGQLGAEVFTASYSKPLQRLILLTKANTVVECDPASCDATKRVLAEETKLDQTYAIFENVLGTDDRAVYYVAAEGTAPVVYKIMRVAR